MIRQILLLQLVIYILIKKMMKKSYLNILAILLIVTHLTVFITSSDRDQLTIDLSKFSFNQPLQQAFPSIQDFPTNGTEGYYLSPHALGKQTEVQKTLINVLPKIKVAKTTYNHSESTYTMDNFTLELGYNDGKQKIQIGDMEEVTVTNGTVFFGYRFNYSVISKNKNVNGWAHGSVYSEALTYKKHLVINNDGHLEWALPRNNAYNQLKIVSRMGLKRMDPYDENDFAVLQEMLDKAFQSIHPSNIESQIIESFNREFFPALNDSLNHEVFGYNINYSYPHPSKGPLNMSIVHHLYGFSVDKVNGFKIIFVTQIDGHEKETTCNITVPDEHSSFIIYGGVQNIHLNCLYQDVVNYIQAQGWLDTALNADWQVNAFQFYAGDLFDMMNNLYTRVNPKSLLEGQCKASKNNLVFKASRQFQSNTYSLTIEYNCSIKTTTKTAESLDILQFVAETRFYIKAGADKLALNFEIVETQVMSLSFTPVNGFIVTNMNLALFKATEVLKKNLNWRVFGSGFPSLPRDMPLTRVDATQVIYYDSSAVELQTPLGKVQQSKA